ncbi:hypothetical protein HCN44_005584 [Aphidius gifuensis]|uniref:U-box domain-containing protein n=1 Tax=Aphidius gifuensis TaxID=684658 RepID=A0A835CVC7_APHGI|nr:hypothetical protein HCN44_005584 [Aphidius gifuensis]
MAISWSSKIIRNCDDDNFSIPSNFYSLIINSGIIDRVKSLRIGIIKTNNSVPAIGKIQVWGEISSFNNPKVYKNIIQLLANKSNKNQHNKSNDIINKTENNVENEIQKSKRNLTNGLNIPDEFLDPITCTIMQQPVVLPSGKIIDQSTLENYEKSEANWGRKLNDPFTGVPFTDTNKPIFSPTIKARIDKFLTANCDADEIKALPRLLGQSVEFKRKNSEEISTTVLKLQKTNSFDKLDDCFVKNQENKLTYNPSSPSSSSTSTSKQIKVDVNSPIDDDLEENLKTVLSGLKRFTDKKVDNDCDNTKNNINCLCCENGIYYKFPCHHIICRKSLLSNRNFKCPNCSKIFSSNDLEKINK